MSDTDTQEAEKTKDNAPDEDLVQADDALENGEEEDSRILNQDEIDSLLGFDDADNLLDDNSGVMALINSAMIYSIVDVLLGGRKGTPAIRIEGRPYTTIETKLVERMVQVVLSDLSSAFDPLSPVSFTLDRIETNPRFATISQAGNACVLARLRVDMGDRGGRIEVVIPYATLEPIRELLLQMFMGEKFGRDSIWENHLTQELHQTDISLQAVLGEKVVSLNEMLDWKVGTQILFNTFVDDELELRCGNVPMFRGPVGQKSDNIAVQIDKYIQPQEEDDI